MKAAPIRARKYPLWPGLLVKSAPGGNLRSERPNYSRATAWTSFTPSTFVAAMAILLDGRSMPIIPGCDPNEAYDVVPMAEHVHGPLGGWWTVT
jgi:hypothetical protein